MILLPLGEGTELFSYSDLEKARKGNEEYPLGLLSASTFQLLYDRFGTRQRFVPQNDGSLLWVVHHACGLPHNRHGAFRVFPSAAVPDYHIAFVNYPESWKVLQ